MSTEWQGIKNPQNLINVAYECPYLNNLISIIYSSALDNLGYGDFRKDAEDALAECKDVAAKKRRQSTRLENLGIPEEELLRQQQELFAKAREAAAKQEQLSLQEASTSQSGSESQITSS